MVDGDENLSPEEIAAKEEADRQAAEDAAKADAAAKAEAAKKEEADKAEAARKVQEQAAAQGGQLTEEQWRAAEKNSGLTRQQLMAVQFIAVTARANSPEARLAERDVFERVKNSLPKDLHATAEDARKEVEQMPLADRTNLDRVREKINSVIGSRLAEGKLKAGGGPGGVTRRGTGIQEGGPAGDDPPSGDLSGMTADEKEVAARYGFKSKAEMEKARGRDISMRDEQDFKPVFK